MGKFAGVFAVLIAASAASPEAPAPLPEIDHVSCKGAPNEVRVVVKNVRESVGLITAELYRNDQATFLHADGRVVRQQFAARAPETRFCLTAPESTSYAIGLYHDKNANHRIDKGALGIPVEPYGLSNNPRIRFAAPTVDEALFHVPEQGVYVEIQLKN